MRKLKVGDRLKCLVDGYIGDVKQGETVEVAKLLRKFNNHILLKGKSGEWVINNKEFKLLEEDCQFKKYGFEVPEFECEILQEYQEIFIGYVVYEGLRFTCQWGRNGKIWDTSKDNRSNRLHIIDFSAYDLTPIKKPWYEDESNFPCLCTPDNGNTFYLARTRMEVTYIINPGEDCIDRLATKEEALSLVKVTNHKEDTPFITVEKMREMQEDFLVKAK